MTYVLFRGGRSSGPRSGPRGLSPLPGGPDQDDAPASKPERVLPRSKIYESRATADSAEPSSPPSLTSKIKSAFRDGKFHTPREAASQLSDAVDDCELVAAFGEILMDGRAFDRTGNYLRMRSRRPGEPVQSLNDLVDGLDMSAVPRTEPAIPESGPDFNPETDASGSDASRADPGSPGLVLSDPPDELTLPLSMVASMTSAILAKRGSGKTYLGMVLLEELMAAPDPPALAVLDPTGAWWGICAGPDGQPAEGLRPEGLRPEGLRPEGLRPEVLLLGGPKGFLPISARQGVQLAELVVRLASVPVVADLSEMAPAEQHRLCADFCECLLGMPKSDRTPVHVVFDEADEFAPQRFGGAGGEQRRSLGQVERLVMRGRSRGIGSTLITLRPAVLSKNVLSQVDALYLLRMVEPNDLHAVREWLAGFERNISADQRSRCLGYLPVLPIGTGYFLRGGEHVMFRRFHVRRKRSYDSSRTPDGVARDAPILRVPSAATLARAVEILSGPGRDAGDEESS